MDNIILFKESSYNKDLISIHLLQMHH